MSIIITERLQALDTIKLDKGEHSTFEDGHCAMEVVAWLAGEGHTDAPQCASRVLRNMTIGLNDTWDTDERQKLAPFLPRMVGTGDDGLDEARSYLALDWMIRTYTPAWLDLAGHTKEAQELRDLRRIVDLATAEAAGPVVKAGNEVASAAESAAWSAARSAARSAAWSAAWSAAESAARSAAWSAADQVLAPTVETLKASALELLESMIKPGPVQEAEAA